MITIRQHIVCKHDFSVHRGGAMVSRGSVEFTEASEQDAAMSAIRSMVAKEYGCTEQELRVYFYPYSGIYDND